MKSKRTFTTVPSTDLSDIPLDQENNIMNAPATPRSRNVPNISSTPNVPGQSWVTSEYADEYRIPAPEKAPYKVARHEPALWDTLYYAATNKRVSYNGNMQCLTEYRYGTWDGENTFCMPSGKKVFVPSGLMGLLHGIPLAIGSKEELDDVMRDFQLGVRALGIALL